MHAIQKVSSFVQAPVVWQSAVALAAAATSVALLILGLHSVQSHMLPNSLGSYDTLAAFNINKTAAYLVGAGAAFGLAAYMVKRIVVCKLEIKFKKNERPSFTDKALAGVRIANRILAICLLVAGMALFIYGLQAISQLPAQQLGSSGAFSYVANAKDLKLLFATLAISGALFSYGLLETARQISHKAG